MAIEYLDCTEFDYVKPLKKAGYGVVEVYKKKGTGELFVRKTPQNGARVAGIKNEIVVGCRIWIDLKEKKKKKSHLVEQIGLHMDYKLGWSGLYMKYYQAGDAAPFFKQYIKRLSSGVRKTPQKKSSWDAGCGWICSRNSTKRLSIRLQTQTLHTATPFISSASQPIGTPQKIRIAGPESFFRICQKLRLQLN